MNDCTKYALRKTGRTLILDSYRSQHGGQGWSFVANRVTEFKILTFGPMEKK
jgi:hypothetical protein